MFRIIYYEKTSGRRPVLEFINSLELNAQAAMLEHIEKLRVMGNDLRRPDSDAVRGRIRELRTRYLKNQYRTLYYFTYKEYIILLNAFQKKRSAIDNSEIDIAEKRMKDFEAKLQTGEIRF